MADNPLPEALDLIILGLRDMELRVAALEATACAQDLRTEAIERVIGIRLAHMAKPPAV